MAGYNGLFSAGQAIVMAFQPVVLDRHVLAFHAPNGIMAAAMFGRLPRPIGRSVTGLQSDHAAVHESPCGTPRRFAVVLMFGRY